VWSGDANCQIIIWNNFVSLRIVQLAQPIIQMCIVDKQVWVGLFKDIVVLSLNGCELVNEWKAHSGIINAVVRVGDKVWSSSDEGICIWNKKTFYREKILGVGGKSGRTFSLLPVLIKGKTHVWSSGFDNTLLIWDADSYALLYKVQNLIAYVRCLMYAGSEEIWSGSSTGDQRVACWSYY